MLLLRMLHGCGVIFRAPVAKIPGALAAAWAYQHHWLIAGCVAFSKLDVSGRQGDVPAQRSLGYSDMAREAHHRVQDMLLIHSGDALVRKKPLEIPGPPEIVAKSNGRLNHAVESVRAHQGVHAKRYIELSTVETGFHIAVGGSAFGFIENDKLFFS